MYSLVSIIIPVYNDAKKFLTETLASVSAQTRTNWECICVDDGCTDASQKMVAEQIRKDGRFRMVCQPNKGISGGRNRGLEVMRGDGFMHMDSDDLLLPTTLEILEDAAEQTGAPIVSGMACEFESTPPSVTFAPGGILLEGQPLREEIFGAFHGLPFPSWAKLYDRKSLGHLRFLPFRYGDDNYYTPITLLTAKSCYLCNATVYLWRVGHVSGCHVKDCSPEWLEGYTVAVYEAAKLFSTRKERWLVFQHAKWIARTLYRSPTFKNPQCWTPKFRETVQCCSRMLWKSMPPFPTYFRWRIRFWLMSRGAFKLLKLVLPKDDSTL